MNLLKRKSAIAAFLVITTMMITSNIYAGVAQTTRIDKVPAWGVQFDRIDFRFKTGERLLLKGTSCSSYTPFYQMIRFDEGHRYLEYVVTCPWKVLSGSSDIFNPSVGKTFYTNARSLGDYHDSNDGLSKPQYMKWFNKKKTLMENSEGFSSISSDPLGNESAYLSLRCIGNSCVFSKGFGAERRTYEIQSIRRISE